MKTKTRVLIVVAAALLAAASAQAKVVKKAVPYAHEGATLESHLAYDDAKTAHGKLPGVLVFPEWWGLNAYARGRAEELAGMGYVALAVDMYGKGVATEDPKKAQELSGPFYGKPLMAERARAGLDQLLKTGLVDPGKVAAIGFCFGGTTAQALALSGAPLAGVVSFHGGPADVPAGLAGKIRAKFLLLNGAMDPMVKPEARTGLEKALEEAKIDYQSVDYAGAVHAFTNPDVDRVVANTPLKGMAAYQEAAARRSWRAMRAFFDEIFGR
ncbi:MAG TPA: dienelactone hydrolase family protein [Thermoanaerobaculia bacterium]|nr:dienelactone hydrolase family protein [Thermoanaerobaculia bacterium]